MDNEKILLKDLDSDLTDKAYQERLSAWRGYLLQLHTIMDELSKIRDDTSKFRDDYCVIARVSSMFGDPLNIPLIEASTIENILSDLTSRYTMALDYVDSHVNERIKSGD